MRFWTGVLGRGALARRGQSHRAAGALMNARGLMEFILVNIGLQKGVIEPGLFSVMVMMAVVTTLMATPLFEWVYGRHARASGRFGMTEGD